MHSKLQLLKFPGYLRLVVPTGNLVPYDWGENGLLENVCAARPSALALVRRADIADLPDGVSHRPASARYGAV